MLPESDCPMSEFIIQQYEEVLQQIRDAAQMAGRDPVSIRLLAVSKTFPATDIAALYQHGCRAFGENRVPELEAKAAVLPPDIEWHLIGQLQSNKVRRAVKTAAVIHSVDSPELLERIDRIAGEERRHPAILLEVNISGEVAKSGCTPEELPRLAALAATAQNVNFRGLMTMAPFEAAEPELDRIFERLRTLRDELEQQLNRPLPELSMGMSGDYRIAIRHGATIVRIGTAIFGRRPLQTPAV